MGEGIGSWGEGWITGVRLGFSLVKDMRACVL